MNPTNREKLLLAAVRGGLAELMKTGAELLGCTLLLGDTLLHVLAWTGDPSAADWTWEGFINAGFAPDFQTAPEGWEKPCHLDYGFSVVFLPNRVTGTQDAIVDLDLGHGMSAHLVLSGLGLDSVRAHADLIATLCLSIRGLLRPDRDTPSRQLSADQFLLQLLRGEDMDEPLIRFRSKLVGLDTEGEFALLLVDLRGYHPIHRSVSTICAQLQAVTGGPFAMEQETLVLLAQGRGPAPDSRWNTVEALLIENGLQGVYSPWFYRLAEAPHYFRRSARALALRVCDPKPAALLETEALLVYLLVDDQYQAEGRLVVDQPILCKLAESDKKGKTAYLDTLMAYLSASQRPAAACAALHIHRNTLDYRLRRMEELIAIDWNDGDLMFRLYFALCTLRYKQLRDR